jgi:hypothetical protein
LLLTISNSGYPGYFLIVQDLIAEASMGVSVGPGSGSAAGSVVAYCLKITNIDPLMYNLLLSVLNPDRHYPILISILMMKAEADGLCDSKIRVETSGKLSPMVKWQPNRQFVIRLVYWIYHCLKPIKLQINSGHDAF